MSILTLVNDATILQCRVTCMRIASTRLLAATLPIVTHVDLELWPKMSFLTFLLDYGEAKRREIYFIANVNGFVGINITSYNLNT